MIANLYFKGKHNVGVTQSGKFDTSHMHLGDLKPKEKAMSIKEVPFVRYSFSTAFCEEDIEFIKGNMQKFKNSCHLVEVRLNDTSATQIQEYTKVEGLIIYLYIPIGDQEAENGVIQNEDIMRQLGEVAPLVKHNVARVMIKDMSTTLYTVTANRLKEFIAKSFSIKGASVGICCSPLTNIDNQCCLSAVKARELAASVGVNCTALPSSNHENKNWGCGCIRHISVLQDAPCDAVINATSTKKISIPKTASDADKEPKKAKPKGLFIPI